MRFNRVSIDLLYLVNLFPKVRSMEAHFKLFGLNSIFSDTADANSFIQSLFELHTCDRKKNQY